MKQIFPCSKDDALDISILLSHANERKDTRTFPSKSANNLKQKSSNLPEQHNEYAQALPKYLLFLFGVQKQLFLYMLLQVSNIPAFETSCIYILCTIQGALSLRRRNVDNVRMNLFGCFVVVFGFPCFCFLELSLSESKSLFSKKVTTTLSIISVSCNKLTLVMFF